MICSYGILYFDSLCDRGFVVNFSACWSFYVTSGTFSGVAADIYNVLYRFRFFGALVSLFDMLMSIDSAFKDVMAGGGDMEHSFNGEGRDFSAPVSFFEDDQW